jgi:hypothetical protein
LLSHNDGAMSDAWQRDAHVAGKIVTQRLWQAAEAVDSAGPDPYL